MPAKFNPVEDNAARQPLSPLAAIDKGDPLPLSSGLVDAFIFDRYTSRNLVNINSHSLLSPSADGVKAFRGALANYTKGNEYAGYGITFSNCQAVLSGAFSSLTVIGAGTVTGLRSTIGPRLSCTPGGAVSIEDGGGGTLSISLSKPNVIACAYDGTSTAICANGTSLYTATHAHYSFNDVMDPIGVISGHGGFSGPVAACFRWKRKLSVAELMSLTANPWQLFEPEQIPLFVPTVTAQYARPTSDVSAGTWTASAGSDLFAMLDETSANDSDYITTTSASTCEVALGSLTDPASSTGHIVRYRISATGGGIIVRLREGSTTIASWTHNPAPASLTTYAQTLSGGEADSITNYAALKLQFEAI